MSFSTLIYLYYLIAIDEDFKPKIIWKTNSILLQGFEMVFVA